MSNRLRKRNDIENESKLDYEDLEDIRTLSNIQTELNERFDATTDNQFPFDTSLQYLSKKTDEITDHLADFVRSGSGYHITGSIVSSSGNIHAIDYFDNNVNINRIYSPIAGGSDIVTTGTVGTGVWNATKILSPKTTHVLHYPFRGFCTGISSGNFQYSEDFSDPQFPFQLNTDYGNNTIAEGNTTNHQLPFRSSGIVAPRACTAIDMVGWASCAAGEVTISLCKLTPSRNSTSAIVPIVVATTTFTSLGNNKIEDFAVSDSGGGDGAVTIVTAPIAKGDILMPFVLSPSTKTTFFNLTLEVES